MKTQVSVIGYNGKFATKALRRAAYEVGREIAKSGAVLITGGLEGVMEAACMGAKSAGGTTVGIIPSDDRTQANKYCDIVIVTGVGFVRNFFVAYSGDAVIIIGGGAGTLIEASIAYQKKKRLIALRGTGGTADRLAGQYVDERRLVKVIGAKSPADAVRKALKASKPTR